MPRPGPTAEPNEVLEARMSIYLVLDILLILLILLLTPIGFWRGPVKELFVTLGVLFGVLLSDYWARPWGDDLADMTTLTSGSGAFLVAMIFLITSTFILGYGMGATLAPARHTTLTRVLGASVAALNGALILSFALQYIRLFLLSDINEESLDKSFVTRTLLNDIGWILLAAAIVAVPVLIYAFVTGYRAYGADVVEQRIMPAAAAQPAAPRGRGATRETSYPPRVPATAGAEHPGYKAEPAIAAEPATRETRPLVVTESVHTTEPEPEDDLALQMSDTDPHIVLPREQLDASSAAGQPATNEPQPKPQGQATNDTPEEAEAQPTGKLPEGYVHCRNCRAVLGPNMDVCPNCGTPRDPAAAT